MVIPIAGDMHTGKLCWSKNYWNNDYINKHFEDILQYKNIMEERPSSDLKPKELCESNEYNLQQCLSHECRYLPLRIIMSQVIEQFLSEGII